MKYIKLSIIILVFFTACDTILEPQPIGIDALDQAIENKSHAILAVNGVYEALAQDGVYAQGLWLVGDLASDDTESQSNDFNNYSVRPENQNIEQIWTDHYIGITRANTVIEKVRNLDTINISNDFKERIVAESTFIRSLLYFNLVRIFGDVPLIVDEVRSVEDATKARTPKQEIYDRIIADLKDVVDDLPTTYSNLNAGEEKGRITSGAAKTLLADIYLTLGNYENAEEWAREVVNMDYSLMPNYEDNFTATKKNNAESIFEVQFSGQNNTTGHNKTIAFAPQELHQQSVHSNNLPTDNTYRFNPAGFEHGIVQDYSELDDRKEVSISNYNLRDLFDPTIPRRFYVDKYWDGNVVPNQSRINLPVYRYAEALLILAEAINRNNNGPTEEAYDAVDEVRNRAGLSNLERGLSEEEFDEAVLKERRIELAFEGKRWFDLKRKNLIEARVKPQMLEENVSFVRNNYLFPLPQSEIDKNPKLTQNEIN